MTDNNWNFADIDEHISALVYRLIYHEPFYGICVQTMSKIIDENLPFAAAVHVKNATVYLSIHPDKFLEYNPKQQQAIIKHEILHLLLNHISRRELRDPKRWNLATDAIINAMIKDIPPNCVDHRKLNLPDNSTAEIYYSLLPQEQKRMEVLLTSAYGEDGPSNIDSHDQWNESDQENELIEQVVKSMASEALEKSRGRIPREVQELVEKLFAPKLVPWETVLRMFVGTIGKTKKGTTWKKCNRRFADQPGSRREPQLNLAICIDTSASVTKNELQIFFNEIDYIYRDKRNVLTIIESDARVGAIYKYAGKMPSTISGRGGTTFKPAIEEVNKMYPRVDGIVYLTDGAGENPTRCTNIPTLWVVTPNGRKEGCAQFGKIIQMKKEAKNS